MRALLAFVPLAATALTGPAHADRLVVSLSTSQIAISSNYTGTQLVLFGVIERDGLGTPPATPPDVVVTVRGPRDSVVVRRKEAFGPLWINRSQQRFAAVPSVLGVYASRPLEDIANPSVRARLRLGIEEIVGAPEFSVDRRADHGAFRDALIRLKLDEGLWSEDPRGVVFVTSTFFRVPLPIPGVASTGSYDVEAVVLQGDTVLAERQASFEVVKAGFEEQVTVLAQRHPLTYGLGVGALSLMFGWFASVIFRRD